MDEETNTTPETPAAPPVTPTATNGSSQGEKTFTQAELDAHILAAKQKAARATEKKVRQEYEAKQQPTQTETPKVEAKAETDDAAALRKELAEFKADAAFNEILAENGFNLDKAQRKTMRKLFDPAEPDAIIETITSLGIGKAKAPEAPPTPVSAAPSVAQPKPIPTSPDPGGPNGAPSGEGHRDPKYWSKDHIQRLQREGRLIAEIEAWRDTLPGGGGPFRRHPKR